MQISIRELKANPSQAIALMQSGERVQITSHRKVVAELVRPHENLLESTAMSDDEAMRQLIASGVISEPAAQPFQLPTLVNFPGDANGISMSDLIIEMRGPR